MTLPKLDRGTIITIIFSGSVLILPLVILRFLYPITPTEAALATIGVGAISRTLFRGFFGVGFRALQRSGIRTLERSAERTVLRTAERTLVRAGGRTFGRILTRVFARSVLKSLFSLAGHKLGESKLHFTSQWWFVLPVTSLVLFHSLWIVTKDLNMAFLVLFPFLTLFALEHLFAYVHKVKITIASPPDGIILQYLFAVTGGFMPLASESAFVGEKPKIARVAFSTLVSLLIGGIVIRELGLYTQNIAVANLGDIFLLFPLILSFPFPPLEGNVLFQHNKLLSIVVWAASLAAFAFFGSEAITHVI